ncbi:MAG: AAA family ATPase [Lachnospiraceae bacterium]|nr:AAA family ATPase [Lachnospiraceae bacterium]
MLNKDKLRESIQEYKKIFPSRWKEEKYKWEAVQCFQTHWDVNADNFYDMFTAATEKTYNLLASMNNFPRGMIQVFAESEPETVRAMFINLFDESKDVSERIVQFQSDAQDVLGRVLPGRQHYQRPMAITVYLWLHNPDKYEIYKYTECRATSQYLENDYIPKKGYPIDNIRENSKLIDEIQAAVNEDGELIEAFNEIRDDGCYSDSSRRTLAFDVLIYIARKVLDEKKAKKKAPAMVLEDDVHEEISQDEGSVVLSEDEVKALHSDSKFVRWQNPIVVALRDLGGSAPRTKVHEQITVMYDIPQEELDATHKSGAVKIFNDIDWARNYLRQEGILESDSPEGMWELTPLGKKIIISDDLAGKIIIKWDRINTAKRNNKPIPVINLEPLYEYITDEKIANPKYDKTSFLKEVYMTKERYDTLRELLLKKQNVILQGAPGVGKTFAAKRLAYSIMGEVDRERVEFIQFHQNYSYEDFVMGYKPSGDSFTLQNGIFYNFCKRASEDDSRQYFFIIDEINRGNMSKIFGEVLMAIEADHRAPETVTLAYEGKSFSVPKNLYMIGMMNTADRSLALIDYALRRRFSFFTMEPGFSSEGFQTYQKGFQNELFDNLIEQIRELNLEISKDPSLGNGFCIGHSYFCGQEECTDEWMQSVVEYDIIPMLEEYWFDDPTKLQKWQNQLRGVFNN